MRSYQPEGLKRWMTGLNNALLKGRAAAEDASFELKHNPYKMYEHNRMWREGFQKRRAEMALGKD